MDKLLASIHQNSKVEACYEVLQPLFVRVILPIAKVMLHVNIGGECFLKMRNSEGFGRGNYFCLADDLLEVYRPAVDYRVSLLNDEDSLQEKAVKKHLVDAVNQQFNGSGLTIPSSLNDFAQQFGLYCEGKIDRLQVPEYVGES